MIRHDLRLTNAPTVVSAERHSRLRSDCAPAVFGAAERGAHAVLELRAQAAASCTAHWRTSRQHYLTRACAQSGARAQARTESAHGACGDTRASGSYSEPGTGNRTRTKAPTYRPAKKYRLCPPKPTPAAKPAAPGSTDAAQSHASPSAARAHRSELEREQLHTHASGRFRRSWPDLRAPRWLPLQVRMPEPPLLLADRMGSRSRCRLDEEGLHLDRDGCDRRVLVCPRRQDACGYHDRVSADLMLISYLVDCSIRVSRLPAGL